MWTAVYLLPSNVFFFLSASKPFVNSQLRVLEKPLKMWIENWHTAALWWCMSLTSCWGPAAYEASKLSSSQCRDSHDSSRPLPLTIIYIYAICEEVEGNIAFSVQKTMGTFPVLLSRKALSGLIKFPTSDVKGCMTLITQSPIWILQCFFIKSACQHEHL